MPHVAWSSRSRRDLDRLYRFLAKRNRTAALKFVLQLEGEIEQLAQFPYLGKPVEGSPWREYTMPFGRAAYLLLYDPRPVPLEILSIRHSREDAF